MSRCGKKCKRESLYASFVQGIEKASIRTTVRQALQQLEEYVSGGELPLCGLGAEGMREFVIRLRSLEQLGREPDLISHWLSITGRFFSFLQERGCVAENPVRILKQQEIGRLLAGMEERGWRRGSLEVPDEKR